MFLTLKSIIILTICAFLFEYTDSTLGMGYGTILTPILLLLGFNPLQIVPTVLLSELFTGLLASLLHHRAGNVNLKPKSINPSYIRKKLNDLGYVESAKRGLSLHLKVALVLGVCSILGTVIAVFLAVNIPKFWLKIYIGSLVTVLGVLIIITLNKNFSFSWKKIMGLGFIASFNKGISGGGYGPVVTAGQILSGLSGRNAIAITSLAEGLTCGVGVISYLLVETSIDWGLAPYLVTGAVLSVPFSVLTVKKIKTKQLKLIVGFFTIILGIFTLLKTFGII